MQVSGHLSYFMMTFFSESRL